LKVDKMDKKLESNRWSWLPQQMPGVAKLMAEKRRTMGNEHVALCWRRGVVEQQPGWFYASEGALAVGTPWAGDPLITQYLEARFTPTQVLLVLRPPEVSHAA
jgi:hypothetical protein